MPHFMLDKELKRGEMVAIEGADAHHISDVLRLRRGDWIVLSDGRGNRFKATIESLDKSSVSAAIGEALPRFAGSRLTLAIALIKHDRLEPVIQKAVELGVTQIAPFTSERTIPKYSDGASARKIERWNKIAIEAAKQCGLPFRPMVGSVCAFDSICRSESRREAGRRTKEHKILFYEGERNNTIDHYFGAKSPRDKDAKTLIVIGPEGGFTSKEIGLAREAGFTTVGLGPLIMRVETAAIAAITLTQYSLGYFTRSR